MAPRKAMNPGATHLPRNASSAFGPAARAAAHRASMMRWTNRCADWYRLRAERRRRARGRARGRAQVVAGRAAFFLGNVWSTFSWAIVEERWARLGAQEDSNALQQAPFSPQELAARGPVRVLR